MDTTVLNSTTGNGQINESQKNDQPKGYEAVIYLCKFTIKS